jgi:hypothetical protein
MHCNSCKSSDLTQCACGPLRDWIATQPICESSAVFPAPPPPPRSNSFSYVNKGVLEIYSWCLTLRENTISILFNCSLTLDVISGRASRDYACGLKQGDVIPTLDTLSNLFGYFKAMRPCHTKLRYFDWDGQVHLAKGKTGGQQGDHLEMLIFNLTIHHL